MKNLKFIYVVFALVGTVVVYQSSASYDVPGVFSPTGFNGDAVSFKCRPTYGVCFSHDGPSSSPTPGDKIKVYGQFGTYDMILMSVEMDGDDENNDFSGSLLNPDDEIRMNKELE